MTLCALGSVYSLKPESLQSLCNDIVNAWFWCYLSGIRTKLQAPVDIFRSDHELYIFCIIFLVFIVNPVAFSFSHRWVQLGQNGIWWKHLVLYNYWLQWGRHKDLSTRKSDTSPRPLGRGEYHFLRVDKSLCLPKFK